MEDGYTLDSPPQSAADDIELTEIISPPQNQSSDEVRFTRKPSVTFAEDIPVPSDSPDLNNVFVTNDPPSLLSTGSISSVQSGNGREKLTHLKSRLKVNDLSQNELELKAALFFHICNPLKRWRVERLVPYKLVLQIVKTALLILQVILFTYSISNRRFIFLRNVQVVFDQVFLKTASNGGNGDVFGERHSYEQSMVIEDVNRVLDRYYQLPNITLGGYGHHFDPEGNIQPVIATLVQYRHADIQSSTTEEYMYDLTHDTSTVTLNGTDYGGSAIEQLSVYGMDLSFTRFIKLELNMAIRSVHITDSFPLECFLFNVTVTFRKDFQKSRIAYHLSSKHRHIGCHRNDSQSVTFSPFVVCLTILDVIVIVISCISTYFTVHSYHRGYTLGKAMGEFYRRKLRISLNWWERRYLFSFWHLFTSFSDILLILGSLLKILLEYNVLVGSVLVRVLLGSALIVQSGAMLRYFSFFKQLNALTRTLSAASPELIKFLCCTSLLYFAFALCGLVVFGSYNEEMFGNFGNSVEILFALINGDSIWLVFRGFNDDDLLIYIYSRFFVYTFIFLFIYAVLNLFTSLVKSAYDNSSLVDRATINEVRRFVFSGPLTSKGVALRDVTYVDKYVDPAIILAKRKHRRRDSIGDLD